MLFSSKPLLFYLSALILSAHGVLGATDIGINALKSGEEEEAPIGPHLRIYYEGYEPTEAETKRITKAVSFLYFFYGKQLGLKLSKNIKIKLRIFGDYYSYKIYQMGFSKSTTDGAFYSSKFDEAVVWKRRDSEVLFRDILHEVSHLMVGNMVNNRGKYFKKRPLWINEGLAEYFENLSVSGSAIEVRPNQSKLNRCRNWLNEDELIPLKDYFALSNPEWKDNDNRENLYKTRTIGWSLMYFLFSHPNGYDMVAEMLEYMVNNQGNREHGHDAVALIYPGGIATLEQDWKLWLMQTNHLAVQRLENSEEPLLEYYPKTKSEPSRGQDE